MVVGPSMAAFELATGAALTIASIWSMARGLKTGVVHGRVNDFRRATSPVSCWLTIGATGLAAALGIALFAMGF